MDHQPHDDRPKDRAAGSPRILIAGIGNIFLGDDGFGVEVAQRLARRDLPSNVRVIDFGIRGIDLTYALLDGYDMAILVDAVPRGEAPGTLFVIEPQPMTQSSAMQTLPAFEGHNLDPARVLALVASLGGNVRRLLVVGCEPAPLDPEQDIQVGLSPPVQAALDQAVGMVEKIVARWLSTTGEHQRQANTLNELPQSKGAEHVAII